MRKLLLGLMLLAPIEAASAASVQVEANTVLRLPVKGESLNLARISVAEGGALLIPSRVKVLHIEELDLQKNARIGVFPGEQPLRIEVVHGTLADGSVIAAQGASGSFRHPASPGRNLTLRLQDVQVANLLVDVRGGVGAPGYDGLDGAEGRRGGCLWGGAEQGGDGQDAGDGQTGGAGGVVRLEVPQQFAVERVKVRLEGGAGGAPGKPGKAGARSGDKGCLLYTVDGGGAGRQGRDGRSGPSGDQGRLDVVRF
ncbi:collagen-like protein [Pseudomonas citronellolis]|uniref:collagen-like protein n=1 Tax=Pseudomonas citronellolis TaxID=53408 RepID=UPI0023E45C26|nr:collagen-like protein [Pseudomonas citronellolis]MDF3933944.1 collagen-like protein [Pseudomonas citronellolis]